MAGVAGLGYCGVGHVSLGLALPVPLTMWAAGGGWWGVSTLGIGVLLLLRFQRWPVTLAGVAGWIFFQACCTWVSDGWPTCRCLVSGVGAPALLAALPCRWRVSGENAASAATGPKMWAGLQHVWLVSRQEGKVTAWDLGTSCWQGDCLARSLFLLHTAELLGVLGDVAGRRRRGGLRPSQRDVAAGGACRRLRRAGERALAGARRLGLAAPGRRGRNPACSQLQGLV
jgi:hypothetical protein